MTCACHYGSISAILEYFYYYSVLILKKRDTRKSITKISVNIFSQRRTAYKTKTYI